MADTVLSAEVFSWLMELVRKHPGRNPLITTAIKCGGKFVEVGGAEGGGLQGRFRAPGVSARRGLRGGGCVRRMCGAPVTHRHPPSPTVTHRLGPLRYVRPLRSPTRPLADVRPGRSGLPAYLPACLSACLPACLPVGLPACLPACGPRPSPRSHARRHASHTPALPNYGTVTTATTSHSHPNPSAPTRFRTSRAARAPGGGCGPASRRSCGAPSSTSRRAPGCSTRCARRARSAARWRWPTRCGFEELMKKNRPPPPGSLDTPLVF
jgi:hypothetical protein